METPTAPLPKGEMDLLRILCCVAWSDGEFSPQEKQLLERVVERYFLGGAGEPSGVATVEAMTSGAMAAGAMRPELLDELVPALATVEDRQLALKLAYQMMRVGPRTGEESGIQPQEKVAYRKLVEGLGLSEAEIRETEWAAEQELKPAAGLRGILASRFGWLAGAWPSDDLLETPGAPRL
jgi:hypothetical protein